MEAERPEASAYAGPNEEGARRAGRGRLRSLLKWPLRLLLLVVLALAALVASWYLNLPQHLVAVLGGSGEQTKPLTAPPQRPVTTPLRLRIATANVECYFCGSDGDPEWADRSAWTGTFLDGLGADLIGLQELVSDGDLKDVLPPSGDFEVVVPRILGRSYADAVILYRSERFRLLESGVVWLGRNQELALSCGWVLGWPRYLNWVLLEERPSGRELFFVNTHFDPNRPNKDASAHIFHETVSAFAQRAPVVAVGDFNTCAEAERFTILTTAPIRDTRQLAGPDRMRTDMGNLITNLESQVIDHVLVAADEVEVFEWRMHDATPGRSDHPFLTADLRLGAHSTSGGPGGGPASSATREAAVEKAAAKEAP